MVTLSGKVLWGPPDAWKWRAGTLNLRDGRVEKFTESDDADEDFSGCAIVPGFIDVHTHGAMGCDFASGDRAGFDKLAAFYASHGVTSVYPTLSALPVSDLEAALSTLADLVDGGGIFKGLHLEAPCLHPAFSGAQNPESLAEPSVALFERFVKAARGKLSLVTMAPELPGGLEAARWLVSRGIKVSAGHSNATYEEAALAFANGVDCVGHFLNAMRAFHQHEPSIPGAVIMNDSVSVEVICDGFHLVPSAVAILDKALTPSRIVCVTDSIAAAGLGDGRYTIASFSQSLNVVNGDAKIAASGVRAGSTLTMDKALRNFMRFTGRPLAEAIRCFTFSPARRMGVEDVRGSIEPGKFADFVVLDEDRQVAATFAEGRRVF